ncbi:MAG: hypothetical protein WC655_04650 [Candidatus Hydrogenedentales bacterium]
MQRERTRTRGALVFAAGIFAWAETFILVGFQYYWAIFKSYPLSTENWWTGLAALTPFLLLLIIGIPACALRFRVALVRLESLLHLTASALLFVLLAVVATQDPFDMLVPFTWPFHLWAIATSFVVLANLARLQRQRLELPEAGRPQSRWALAAVAVFVWGIVLGTAVASKSPAWCWAVSLAAHALMAPYAAKRPLSSVVSVPLRQRAVRGAAVMLETVALGLVVLLVSMQLATATRIMGSLEVKFVEVFQPYVSGWFLVGVLFAILAKRLKFAWLAHAVVVGVALFAVKQVGPMLPALLGYALAAMFMANARQTTLGYGVSALVVTAVWVLSIATYAFSAMVPDPGMPKDMASLILQYGHTALPIAFAAAALLALALRFAKEGASGLLEAPHSGRGKVGLLYVAIIVLAIAPSLYVIALKSGPPFLMQRADRIPVKEPGGVCHAGYSRSDDEYAILDQLGASIMRVDFHWSSFQPNPDTWTFDDKDAYVAAAETHGKKVLALLDFDNNGVEQDPVGKERDLYIAPQDVPLFLEYVRRVVTHYGDRIYAWEIWNEPSLTRFWDGPAEEFYDLAKQVANTLHEIDPNLRVVGTAMHGPLGIWTPHQSEGLFAAGAMAYVDHPSFHLYATDPRAYPNEFSKYLALNKKYGHDGALWITELGDPDGGFYPWRATPEQLAEHAIKSYTTATSYGVETLVWYCLQDGNAEQQREHRVDSECFFGLLGPDREWKPAAYAYSLFNTHCSNSELRSGLVDRTGGLTARQVRASLYRRADGESTLILWYDPVLSGQRSVRVALNFEDAADTPVVHDIGSSYTKQLLDDVIDVSEHPTVITYRASNADAPVHVAVKSAVVDSLLIVSLAAGVVFSGMACAAARRD